MPQRSLLLAAALLCAAPAVASDKTAKPPHKTATKKASGFKFDGPLMNMPGEALPTGEKLEKKADKAEASGKESVGNATYDVVRVQHGRVFMRSPAGAVAQGGELTQLSLSGNPPTTDKFTTIIRVKSKARNNVPIEVALVDPRGDTVMSSPSGTVVFFGAKQDEVDYQIDWEPTTLRSGGEYKLLVRVANEVKGTWPLKVAEQQK